ncbi:LacI family DNA-binding transcriptional regulator [Agromyces sp. ISL-38]|uniref:LacI family DNA-binding transcriptional regulator n=1 Tax=Agromyces sp. ISL-38 TaxID=2819107 RepID=UPI0027E0B4D0|nr:LacI family DNA-binding transcriptional regulator [Agromyces sp. ISL-38]
MAAKSGVSVATVSRVLAGNYPTSEDAKKKVLAAIDELNYVMNAHARGLAGQGTRTIAILVEQVTSPFYAAVAQGVEEQAAAGGRLCLICTTHGDPAQELALVNMLRDQGTDAVIIVGGITPSREYEIRMARYAESLNAVGSVLVLCGRPRLDADVPHLVVAYENEEGAYAATNYILSKGHEDVIFVGGVEGISTTDDRVRGFRRAMQERGLPTEGRVLLGSHREAFGRTAVQERLARGRDFTAIVAYNDHIAAGALLAVRQAGLRVPEDVSVIGYDDSLLASNLTPALTSVAVPAQELGRTAVRRALEHQDGDVRDPSQVVTLATHVVVRDSVARPRA